MFARLPSSVAIVSRACGLAVVDLMKQWRMVRRYVVAGLGLAWILTMPASTVVSAAAWPFHIAFDHSGLATDYYQLCVNGQCSAVDARRTQAGWRVPLPLLSPGEYRLVVQACSSSAGTCAAGTPDLMIRVVPGGTSRRPPIDVIDGPRIPTSNR